MGESLKVLTANVAGQERFGFAKRKQAAHDVFAQSECDIVGFQELGITNWEEVFGKARPDLEIVHGQVAGDIVINSFAYRPSRFELLRHHNVWLSPHGTFERAWGGSERGMTFGEMKDRMNGRRFLFVNTHLDNVSMRARYEGMIVVLRWIRPFSDIPIIFTADANVSVDSPHERWREDSMRLPYDILNDSGFVDAWMESSLEKKRPFTYHGGHGPQYDVFAHDEYGTFDTDWIWVRGFKVLDCRLISDSSHGIFPSDHYWMEATLDWPK